MAAAGVIVLAWAAVLGRETLPLRAWLALLIAGAFALGWLVVAAATRWAPTRISPRAYTFVFAVALLGRFVLVGTPHELSDDSARYQWDGRVLVHGINPYRYAPDDPPLALLRAQSVTPAVNHPDLHTVYPPLAEGFFALAHLLDRRGLVGLHVLQALAELACAILLARILAREGLPGARLLLVAWLPLVMLEGYAPGHVDTLTLPFVVLALDGIQRRQPLRAGAFLALAALIKPYPLLMVPAALREFGARGSARFLISLGLVAAAAYMPFAGAGHWLFDSMWLMARTWSFNGSVAAWLERLLPAAQAHLVAGGLMLALVLVVTWWGAGFRERVLLAVAAFVICTPTLYPWYLVWAVPLLVLVPDAAVIAILQLAPLSYLVLIAWQEQGSWTLPGWVPLAEYVPFYALLAAGAWRRTGMFRKVAT